MNNNRLTLKDYILIYFFVFLLAAFLGGFFLGAKVMESQLLNYPNTDTTQEADPASGNKEITVFNDKIFEPVRIWNKQVNKMINPDGKQNEAELTETIENGEFLLSNIKTYSFESYYLKEAVIALEQNLESNIKALEQQDQQLLMDGNNYYLNSQKNFYRSIWLWEQSADKNNQEAGSETMTDWEEWGKSGLHQKNYITTIILEKEAINTFVRPEDITVHIDAYLKSGSNTSVGLKEIIRLLVSSEAVHDSDFKRYKEQYPNTNYPDIVNYQ